MIRCPKCGIVSHNPNDERERYCGNCHQFHEFMGIKPMKQYLGDSVYAQYVEDEVSEGLVLTTENGMGPTNTIFIEAAVFASLIDFVNIMRERNGTENITYPPIVIPRPVVKGISHGT